MQGKKHLGDFHRTQAKDILVSIYPSYKVHFPQHFFLFIIDQIAESQLSLSPLPHLSVIVLCLYIVFKFNNLSRSTN